MVLVHIPPLLRDLTNGVSEADVDASTLRQVIRALDARFPGMWDRLCNGDAVHPEIAVVINGEIVGRALIEPVPEGAEAHFVPAVAGGGGSEGRQRDSIS